MVQTRHRVSIREALAGVQLMQAVGHRTTTAMKWPALQWYMSSCHHFHGTTPLVLQQCLTAQPPVGGLHAMRHRGHIQRLLTM
jgi:hypothetical protein